MPTDKKNPIVFFSLIRKPLSSLLKIREGEPLINLPQGKQQTVLLPSFFLEKKKIPPAHAAACGSPFSLEIRTRVFFSLASAAKAAACPLFFPPPRIIFL